jgi:hypothetical protein
LTVHGRCPGLGSAAPTRADPSNQCHPTHDDDWSKPHVCPNVSAFSRVRQRISAAESLSRDHPSI